MNLNKIFMPRAVDLKPKWIVIDAAGEIVGRLATRIAKEVQGKNTPMYTPHAKTGNYIIIVNAEKVIFTSDKMDFKMYRRYTGYVGNVKTFTAKEAMKKHPTYVLEKAIERMLPKSKMGKQLLNDRIKLYAGPEHPHSAQVNN